MENKITIKNIFSNIKEKYKLEKELNEFVNEWMEIMFQTKLKNEDNKTFTFENLKKKEYGYSCSIVSPKGLNFDMLEKVKVTIEDNMGCMFILNRKKRSQFANAQFIFKTPVDLRYKPFKVKPFEIYVGNDFAGKPIIISMLKYPHVLITGGTRSGKSKMTDCVLTTLIENCNEFELELYLIQVAKSDLVMYEDAIQTRGFADNLEKSVTMLNHIQQKMEIRDRLIRPYRKKAMADNYMDYNKINPTNKLSTCYVVLDEMASLFDTKGDDKVTKKTKEQINKGLDNIAQYGASLGVFLISSLQRPTVDKLSPFIKSQSTCKISFRQNNRRSSEVALDDPNLALGLEQREAIYYTNTYNYILVPYAYSNEIIKFIQHKLKPNHRTMFHDLEKINDDKKQDKDKPDDKGVGKIKINEGKEQKNNKNNDDFKQNYDKVDPDIIESKENELKDNISKIPNFVPYTPIDTNKVKVIDGTKIDPNKTEKPKKSNGRVKINDN